MESGGVWEHESSSITCPDHDKELVDRASQPGTARPRRGGDHPGRSGGQGLSLTIETESWTRFFQWAAAQPESDLLDLSYWQVPRCIGGWLTSENNAVALLPNLKVFLSDFLSGLPQNSVKVVLYDGKTGGQCNNLPILTAYCRLQVRHGVDRRLKSYRSPTLSAGLRRL